MYEFASTNEFDVINTVTPQSASGGAATIDGALRITVQSGDATFTQDPAEPLVYRAVSGPSAGVTDYLVEGDADLGTGEVLISEVHRYTVSGPQAAGFSTTSNVVPKLP